LAARAARRPPWLMKMWLLIFFMVPALHNRQRPALPAAPVAARTPKPTCYPPGAFRQTQLRMRPCAVRRPRSGQRPALPAAPARACLPRYPPRCSFLPAARCHGCDCTRRPTLPACASLPRCLPRFRCLPVARCRGCDCARCGAPVAGSALRCPRRLRAFLDAARAAL
jgi:hypothetical protein